MQRDQALSWITHELSQKYPPLESQHLAVTLICWALSITHPELRAHPRVLLTTKEHEVLKKALHEHLIANKPLQYSMESVPFLSATINLRPPILIPRPETEQWCDYLITELKRGTRSDLALLDLCTGSGCVAIALAQAFPKGTIYAIDISAEAIALTQENILINKITNVIPVRSDLFTEVPKITFDAIVSNPPYVSVEEWKNLDPGITQWEDPQAFLAGSDGLTIIKKIITEAPFWLSYERDRQIPQLLIECGEYQAERVASSMEEAGFEAVIHQDYAGKDRFVTGILRRIPS